MWIQLVAVYSVICHLSKSACLSPAQPQSPRDNPSYCVHHPFISPASRPADLSPDTCTTALPVHPFPRPNIYPVVSSRTTPSASPSPSAYLSIASPSSYLRRVMFRSSSLSQASKLPISLVDRRIWNVRGSRKMRLRSRSLTEPRDRQRSSHQDFINRRTRSPSDR